MPREKPFDSRFRARATAPARPLAAYGLVRGRFSHIRRTHAVRSLDEGGSVTTKRREGGHELGRGHSVRNSQGDVVESPPGSWLLRPLRTPEKATAELNVSTPRDLRFVAGLPRGPISASERSPVIRAEGQPHAVLPDPAALATRERPPKAS